MIPTSTAAKVQKAVLVALQLPKVTEQETEGSLDELTRLVTTMGAQVIARLSQRRETERSPSVLGDGKLRELARWTGGPGEIGPLFVKKKHKAALKFTENQAEEESDEDSEDFDDASDGESDTESDAEAVEDSGSEDQALAPTDQADIVVFDCELSPSQLRNMESATGATVYDRTGVIIEIFSRHARTRAAKLQVEIARLTYLAPRLRETGGADRQEGGGGKGSGETAIELDRRNIRDRIKELKEELKAISVEQDQRRTRRGQELTVALVGYTNAGKSSLMRALTGSEVLVQDKLFATLDTTVRTLHPESIPKILVSDTVGFIKKLPHDLVASFKSTLDEALSASLLLYVVDASDPSFRSQLEVTRTVLGEVGVEDVQSLLILNKQDKLSPEQKQELQKEFPEAYFLSAKNTDDVAALRLKIIGYFESDMIDQEIFIPYQVQGVIGEVRSRMRVLGEQYDEKGLHLKVRAKPEDVQFIRNKFKLDAPPDDE